MILDSLDKSFLRLTTDFSVAKSDVIENSQYVYKENIIINPNKIYTQISNSQTDIAFDGSYIVELVDCNDNAILDITNKIFINEFQDINGIYQIAFEIAPIKQDFYYEHLFLRFKHLGSDLVLWSNPFFITANEKTLRIEYKNYSYYQGISYDRANYYQSIDVIGNIDLVTPKETTNIYTQLNGDIRRGRTIQSLEYSLNIGTIDAFTISRLMVALNSDLVYINGIRFKTSKNVESDERIGRTNLTTTSFKGQFEEKDKLNLGYQIAPPFTLISKTPFGQYTTDSINYNAEAGFNVDLVSVSNVKLFNYDTEALIQSYSVTIDTSTFFFTLDALSLGTYYITFDCVSIYGQEISITDKETWKFIIGNGDYNPSQYNNLQYFIG